MVNVGIRMTNVGEYLMTFAVNAEKDEMGKLEIPNTLKDFKREINTDCIDMDDIVVDGMTFKAMFGANAKDGAHTSCVDENGKVVYKGNIIVFGFDTDRCGNQILRSLTDEEIELLMKNTGLMTVDAKGNGGDLYNAYILCNVTIKN